MRTTNTVVRFLIGVILFTFSQLTYATPLGYELEISGNFNLPRFRITNLSEDTSITSFRFSVGDKTRNFDGITDVRANDIEYTLLSPDTLLFGGKRSDWLEFNFSQFLPGRTFEFIADIDDDSRGDTFEDYRFIFFNNGDDENSTVEVGFNNASTLTMRIPDYASFPTSSTVHVFSQFINIDDSPTVPVPNSDPITLPIGPVANPTVPAPTISPSPRALPEPTTVWLLLAGLTGILFINQRRITLLHQ